MCVFEWAGGRMGGRVLYRASRCVLYTKAGLVSVWDNEFVGLLYVVLGWYLEIQRWVEVGGVRMVWVWV